MLRWFVALTPLVGAILLPLVVPIIIEQFGIAPGIISVLLLVSIWFVAMLRTSEMPH